MAARRLAKTVMLTDPETGRGVTLLPGCVPPPELAALIRNPHAWEPQAEPDPEKQEPKKAAAKTSPPAPDPEKQEPPA